MTGADVPCGLLHRVLDATGVVPQLIVACMRPAGHEGQHCAIWPNAFIEWET